MESKNYKLAPGETVNSVLSKEMGLNEGDIMGVLPIFQIISIEIGEGIIVGLKGEETGFSVLLSKQIADDLIEALSRALPN